MKGDQKGQILSKELHSTYTFFLTQADTLEIPLHVYNVNWACGMKGFKCKAAFQHPLSQNNPFFPRKLRHIL